MSYKTHIIRVAACYMAFMFLAMLSSAQAYIKATQHNGTSNLSGYNVTVTPVGAPYSSSHCGATPYHIGKNIGVADGFEFRISPPTHSVKLEFTASDETEVIEVWVNGVFYNINTSEISSFPGLCNNKFYAYIFNGRMNFSGPIVALDAGTTLTINSTPISSIRVMETGAYYGSVFNFWFAKDTVVGVDSVNSTAYCQGDSIYVKYSAANFLPGNKFMLQLSDGGGSFTNPLLLDSVSSTISGVFKTTLPKNILPGTKYKVRIISYYPARTSINTSKEFSIKLVPSKPVLTANDTLCTNATLNLSSISSTPGVTYSWTGPGGFSAGGAFPSRANMITAWSGNYIATAELNGCIARDTIPVLVHPVTPKPTAGSNNPVCVGGDIHLTSTLIPGATYYWGGPALYYSFAQNPIKTGAVIKDIGKYWVVATLNGCASEADTTSVLVTQGPEVLVYPSPGDSICPGWDVNFTAIPKNGGGNPTYQWYKNGSAVATGSTYKATGLADGDSFYVRMTAGTVCNTPISSKPIRITVLPVHSPPVISIAVSPGTHVWPYVEVTFTALTTNAGLNPGYQWKRNGANISLAQDSILKLTDLKLGDTICCVVTSNFLCAVPRDVQSNCFVMNVDVGIENSLKPVHVAQLYPNPNNGEFILHSNTDGILHISNAMGVEVYKAAIHTGENQVKLNGVASGVYTGRLIAEDGNTGTPLKILIR
jgi:hypothetical protein